MNGPVKAVQHSFKWRGIDLGRWSFDTTRRICDPCRDIKMEIKQAIITAAGRQQRALPLQTLVDRDGISKPALQILLEETLEAGIEELCVVVHPGDQPAYAAAAGRLAGRVQFVEQVEPRGYGHAVSCGRDFAGGKPFLLLVGDHLYVSSLAMRCAGQLVELARNERCSISAVHPTHESKLPFYGAVGGRRVAGRQDLYEVADVVEKATPTEAEQRLMVPGLRAGHYLCFFGMHVLTPALMELLSAELAANARADLSLCLARLAKRERYLACTLQGHRYDIGRKYGLLTAQLALALDGKDRDEVLTGLVELLANRIR